jgi:hypothetical protein
MNSLSGFKADHYPDLVRRVHAAIDVYLRMDSRDELAAVAADVMKLPKSELLTFSLELFATAGPDQSGFLRCGIMSGTMADFEQQQRKEGKA